MTWTHLICTIVIISLGIYDGVAVTFGGLPTSISRWLSDTGFAAPSFVFMFGFIAGHVFGYMRPTLKTAFAPMLSSLPRGWSVDISISTNTLVMTLYSPSSPIPVLTQNVTNSDVDEMVRVATSLANPLNR